MSRSISGERLGTVRRGRGDHDRDIADLEPAHAMLDRALRARDLGFALVAQARHLADRHRRVRLVFEVIDDDTAAVATRRSPT